MNGTLWVHEPARLAIMEKMVVLPFFVRGGRMYKLLQLSEGGYTSLNTRASFRTHQKRDGSQHSDHASSSTESAEQCFRGQHKPSRAPVRSAGEGVKAFADRILDSIPTSTPCYKNVSYHESPPYYQKIVDGENVFSIFLGYTKFVEHLLSELTDRLFEEDAQDYSGYSRGIYESEYAQWVRSFDFLSSEAGDSADITELKLQHAPYVSTYNPKHVNFSVVLRDLRELDQKYMVIHSFPREARNLLQKLDEKSSYKPETPLRSAIRERLVGTPCAVDPVKLEPIPRRGDRLSKAVVLRQNELVVPKKFIAKESPLEILVVEGHSVGTKVYCATGSYTVS